MREASIKVERSFTADLKKTDIEDILRRETYIKIEGFFSDQEVTTLLFLIGSWGDLKKKIIKRV